MSQRSALRSALRLAPLIARRRAAARRWLARLGGVAAASVVLVAAVLVPAVPAQAHDVGGVGATNFRTTLGAVTPGVPGLTVTVIENGSRLELRNLTGTDVMIAGYAGEPYARVGPTGVFVNDNSPATYLNASRFSTTAVPDTADPAKPPAWARSIPSRSCAGTITASTGCWPRCHRSSPPIRAPRTGSPPGRSTSPTAVRR